MVFISRAAHRNAYRLETDFKSDRLMRILNPKFALATIFLAFGVWLAMTGKLTEFFAFARSDAVKDVVK